MIRPGTVLAGLLVLVAPGAATSQSAAQDTELRRCAAIEDASERLACFDALAADTLTDGPEPAGTRRYGTRRDGDDTKPHRYHGSRTVVHIVGYVYVGPRGRGRPYYLDRDGNRLPVADGEDPQAMTFPFDAEVVPDPGNLDAFRVRRLPETAEDSEGYDRQETPRD